MGLRLKFNLVLLAVFVVGLGVTGYISYELLHRNARDEVLRSAGVMMEASLSMRHYTVAKVRPLLPYSDEKFLPEGVPAFAATEIMGQLRKKYPAYTYKEAALNPTNPRNRAVEWETDIVNVFRNDTSRAELTGIRETPTGPSLYLARPFQIKDQACFACHTTAEMAPPAMVKIYGPSNGFGWKLNEVIGAQIVSVPMDLPI
jgi:protein-histidine pros-kinase